jgi:hypothetical protein
MWALYAYNVTIGNARVWNFNLQLSQTFGVHVLCHEMSHSLGFPDLYRYTYSSINPVGPWDVMSSTTNPPQHQTVYTKEKYGHWTSSIPEITTPGTYSLRPLSSDPFAAYKIASPNSSSEYFVVEYRKTAGMFEGQLLGSGLIIYRVSPSVNGNSFGPPDELYICRPNGTLLDDGNLAQAFYSSNSGRTSFGGTNCFLSNGAPGGIQITNIGSAGETISFTVGFGTTPQSVLAVTPISRDMQATGGTSTFSVSNTGAGTMNWSAAVTSGGTWAHITSGSNGTNSGSINLSVDANTTTTARTATITVTANDASGSPKTISIQQAGAAAVPVLSVAPDLRSLDYTSGSASYSVSNTGGGTLTWSATVTAGATWAHIVSGSNGTNAGTIAVSADANTDTNPRTATITVTATGAGTRTLTIAQAAAPAVAVLSVTPDSRSLDYNAGSTSFSVSNTGGGTMTWSAAVANGTAWARITAGSNGSNAGTISVVVDANTESTSRTATITVTAGGAGTRTLTVAQSAAPAVAVLYVAPDSRSLDYNAGSASFSVSNTGGGTMAWSASVASGNAWARITSGSTGNNAGTIQVTVDANTENTVRTATVTVTAAGTGSKTLTIMQAAAPAVAVLYVTPDSRSLDYNAGSASFLVSNTGGGTMPWTATVATGNAWARITTGSNGSNSGNILISIDANSENISRTATITVSAADAGSKTLTISQGAAPAVPVLFVTPDSRSLDYRAAFASFSVSNNGGGSLSWTASVTGGTTWAHILSGSNGTNSGTINVAVDANTEYSPRTATLTLSAEGAGSRTLTIFQAAAPAVTVLNVTPDSRNLDYTAGSSSFTVSNIGGGSMDWSASVATGSTWAHITSGFSGTNNGEIIVTVDGNNDSDLREAVIVVTNNTDSGTPKTLHIYQQAGKPVLSINHTVQELNSEGGNAIFAVSNSGTGNLSWTAAVTSGSSWIRIVSGSNGSNSGNIELRADVNNGQIRTATITVTANGGAENQVNLTIVEAAPQPVLEIDPDNQTIGYEGGIISFGITKSGEGSITWSADVTEGADWTHINSGITGNDKGKIVVKVDANPGEPRTSIITVTSSDPKASPRIITINQDISNGVNPVVEENQITVYPNPSVKDFTVQIADFNGMQKKLEVLNMMGQVESTKELTQETTTVDCSELPQGMYIFRVTSENNEVSFKRVIKN